MGQRVPYVSEIQCPTYLEYENCLDWEKLKVFRNFSNSSMRHKVFYQQLFGFSQLTVQELFPRERNITFYDNPKQGFSSRRSVHVPISVYDPQSRSRSFAVLEIKKYS